MPRLQRFKRPSLILLILIAALLLSGTVGDAATGRFATGLVFEKAQASRIATLRSRVAGQGAVRLIVEVALESELFLSGAGEAGNDPDGARNNAIHRAQDRLKQALQLPDENMLAFEHSPYLALQADEATLEAILARPDVLAVYEDQPRPLTLAGSTQQIGAPAAWADGYTGAGQAVAILDTGVDADHPFLDGKVIAEGCFSGAYSVNESLCPNGNKEMTGSGAGGHCSTSILGCDHGTHVAGIAAGSGSSFSGVAPQADIIAIQVFSRFTGSECSDVGMPSPCIMSYTADEIRALEYVYALRQTHAIASVNMSLGGGSSNSPCVNDPIRGIVQDLYSVGIATVIASGNEGQRSAISAPACIPEAISVGAVTGSDQVASFSNIASFIDILAPGTAIQSSVPGTGYQSWDGTSMATPHVAGAVAVMRSKNPQVGIDEMLTAFRTSGVAIDDQRSGGSVDDIPRLQLDAALALIDVVIPQVFEDVSPDYWAHDEIVALYENGYFAGCSTEPRLFCPEATMNRAESAVIIERGIYGADIDPETPAQAQFADLALDSWAARWVQALWDDGYTAGCGIDPLLFCPWNGHSRAESAVFFLRMLHGAGYEPPEPGGIFADVPLASWSAKWIEQAYLEGIAEPCQLEPTLLYCPQEPLTRARAAVMMARAKGIETGE